MQALAMAFLVTAAVVAPMVPAYCQDRRVPSPGYRPVAGDEVSLFDRDRLEVPCADGMSAYEEMAKSFKANDKEGIEALKAAKQMIMIPSETLIRVLEVKRFVTPAAVEVRVLDGQHKGETFWVHYDNVANLVKAPKRRPRR